jgi:DNA methylase
MNAQHLSLDAGPALDEFFASVDRCRDKRSFTHALHPYPAKFIPEIPRALLQALGRGYGTVLDPMCGSGTTLVEATLAGYTAVGVDLNPIATLIAAAKTTRLTPEERGWIRDLAVELRTLARAIRDDHAVVSRAVADETLPVFVNRDKWFAPHVLRELQLVLNLGSRAPTSASVLVVNTAFSAAVVVASNQESETRWCAKPRDVEPGATCLDIARRLDRSLVALAEYAAEARAEATVLRANARSVPLGDESVDLVITSPPYANSHDYYLYNKLRLFWFGHDVRRVQVAEIGSRNRHSDMSEPIETYLDEMGEVIRDSARVLKTGGTATFVVADSVIRGELFDMRALYRELGQQCGLRLAEKYEFAHQRLNTMFPSRFGTSRAKTTHVLVFEKA